MVQAHLPRDSTVRSGMDINLQLRESLTDMPQSGGGNWSAEVPSSQVCQIDNHFPLPSPELALKTLCLIPALTYQHYRVMFAGFVNYRNDMQYFRFILRFNF